MAKKRKAAKKPAAKKVKKAAARPARKPVRKASKKASSKKVVRKLAAPRGRAVRVPSALEGVYVPADAALQGRLRRLADSMKKPLDAVLLQALGEFADNWEDHQRTVDALNAGDDRVQLVVPQESSDT